MSSTVYSPTFFKSEDIAKLTTDMDDDLMNVIYGNGGVGDKITIGGHTLNVMVDPRLGSDKATLSVRGTKPLPPPDPDKPSDPTDETVGSW